MYIIYVKDDLGGWLECGAYDSYDGAYEEVSLMSKDDPFHQYKIVLEIIDPDDSSRVMCEPPF